MFVGVLVIWSNTSGKIISRVNWRDCTGTINDAVTKEVSVHILCNCEFCLYSRVNSIEKVRFSIASVLEQKS